MKLLKKIGSQKEFALFSVLLVIVAVMWFASPVFSSIGNLRSLFMALSIETLIAVGMTILMVSGGFDMSVGSVLGFSGMTAAILFRVGVPLVPTVIITLLIGACIGMFHGFIVAKVGINPFITTLAGLSIFRGLTFIISNGENVPVYGSSFEAIGQSVIFGIQMPIWYALIIVIVGDIVLRRSRFFRQNYYIGGNEKAARLSGINVDRMKIFNYALTSFLAALAGIVMTARVGSASVNAGTGLELRVITAVIIGGASLRGGEGSALGTFFGSLLMVLIMNVMTLFAVNVYWQNFVIGATLLIAVLIDTLSTKSTQKKLKVAGN
jgi:ribose transport system permease protein